MPPEITPIIEEPALIVRNTETSLVVADIHLGIEWDLYRKHVSQYEVDKYLSVL